jgi:hypothetical protein
MPFPTCHFRTFRKGESHTNRPKRAGPHDNFNRRTPVSEAPSKMSSQNFREGGGPPHTAPTGHVHTITLAGNDRSRGPFQNVILEPSERGVTTDGPNRARPHDNFNKKTTLSGALAKLFVYNHRKGGSPTNGPSRTRPHDNFNKTTTVSEAFSKCHFRTFRTGSPSQRTPTEHICTIISTGKRPFPKALQNATLESSVGKVPTNGGVPHTLPREYVKRLKALPHDGAFETAAKWSKKQRRRSQSISSPTTNLST